jgi:hypothetical protein
MLEFINNYTKLTIGWNILVEMGLNLDKPNHARKIENEYSQTYN